MAARWTRPIALVELDERDLDRLRDDAHEVARAAPGVGEILDAVAGPLDAARDRRGEGPHQAVVVHLPQKMAADPASVIVDQREAMARAVDLRDDLTRPQPVREVWAAVVERLALARREAKDAVGTERRHADPRELDLGLEVAARRSAGGAEIDEGAGLIAGAAAERAAAGRPDQVSGVDEPAGWQSDRPTATPASSSGDPAITAVEPDSSPGALATTLTRGAGLAGGTGGTGSGNLPADTGREIADAIEGDMAPHPVHRAGGRASQGSGPGRPGDPPDAAHR